MTQDIDATRESNAQTFRRAIGAITAQDLSAIRAELHESVVFELPFQANAPTLDREGYLQLLSTMFVMFETLELTISVIYDCVDPDLLIARWLSHAKGREKPVDYENEYIGVLRFDGGKIVSWRGYANPEAANAALAGFAEDLPVVGS